MRDQVPTEKLDWCEYTLASAMPQLLWWLSADVATKQAGYDSGFEEQSIK
jgi:hypothetical protein